jgi:hypothetical protein
MNIGKYLFFPLTFSLRLALFWVAHHRGGLTHFFSGAEHKICYKNDVTIVFAF